MDRTRMIVEGILHWIISQCHNGPCKLLRSRSILHALGIILCVSGVFRFYLDFQPLGSLFQLLFNWVICTVLESMGVEILFQISWRQLKFQNITPLRYFALVLIFLMGLVNVYSMWQLCMEVRDCVAYQGYNWMIVAPPMLVTVSTAMLQTLILAICVPVQVIVISLECNRNIHLKSCNITLTVNLWLFVHFIYLSINYYYYSYIALLYRLFCTMWMFLYCYPVVTRNTYHWFKQQLPNWIRPLLRSIRDNKLVIKVWRNLRAVIEQRREGNTVDDQTNILHMLRSLRNAFSDNINGLWTLLCRNVLPCLISCILVSCLLIQIGCEFTVVALPIHHMFTYLIHRYFNSANQSTAVITDNEPATFVTNSNECTDKTATVSYACENCNIYQSDLLNHSCFISCSDGNSFDKAEEFVIHPPTQNSESDYD